MSSVRGRPSEELYLQKTVCYGQKIFHRSSIDKRPSTGLLCIEDLPMVYYSPSTGLLYREDFLLQMGDLLHAFPQVFSIKQTFNRFSIDRRPSKYFLQAEDLIFYSWKTYFYRQKTFYRYSISRRSSIGLQKTFNRSSIARRPSTGLLQKEDLHRSSTLLQQIGDLIQVFNITKNTGLTQIRTTYRSSIDGRTSTRLL